MATHYSSIRNETYFSRLEYARAAGNSIGNITVVLWYSVFILEPDRTSVGYPRIPVKPKTRAMKLFTLRNIKRITLPAQHDKGNNYSNFGNFSNFYCMKSISQ
jgi:hypothetical protein